MSEKSRAAVEHIKQNPSGIDIAAKLKKEGKFAEDPIAAFLDIIPADLVEGKKVPALDFSYLSPEQKAESMWALYKEAWRLQQRINTQNFRHDKFKEAEKQTKSDVEEEKKKTKKMKKVDPVSPEDKRKLQMILSALRELHSDQNVREIYLSESARVKKEKDDINGRFEEYQNLSQKILTDESTVDNCAKRIFGSRGKGASEINVLLYESCRRQIETKKGERQEILKDSGDLAALAEYQTMRMYSNQLRQENFIWSPSRRELLERLETAAFSGQPVLLSGESGTGKTRLVEQASLVLTGRICNETPGKDTRFQDLIAKPKIAPGGQTYYEYKEVGEAVAGRDSTLKDQADHRGRIVADDEFNLLESSEQTARLARVAEWTPGKRVRMPVTNQEIVVAPNFLYCAMVNLASERYERKKIPPEVLRKFAKVDVGYPPQSNENPELYEMMVSALMDQNGRLRAAESEVAPEFEYEENEEWVTSTEGERAKATVRTRRLLEVKTVKDSRGRETTEQAGSFLWRFANAIAELNKSFSRQATVLKAKGEGQFVKDMIIDMGQILGFLKQYVKMGQGKNLEEFVLEKIKEQFLDRDAYTKEDRALVREFLLHFDIDVDAKAARPRAEFKNFSPVEIGLLSPRVEYRKIVKQEIDVNEGSYIEPNGTRVEFIQESWNLQGKEIKPGTVLKSPDGKRIKFIGIRKDNGQPVFQQATTEEKDRKPKTEEEPKETRKIGESLKQLQDSLNQRAKELGFATPKLDLPRLRDVSREHLAVFEKFLGGQLDASTIPEVRDWNDYLKIMYPKKQRKSDKKNGLVSYHPDWWEQNIDEGVVGGKEKCREAYRRSIEVEAESLQGRVFLTEAIQKPNYIDGTQQYSTKEGTDASQDKLLPIIQEVLGSGNNRFNLNWDQVNQVAVRVKEKITEELQAKRLAIPDFDIMITPAIISNLEMTLRHLENSSTTTYEWSSTPLLKMDKKDSGCRLLVGRSDDGGAGYVSDAVRGDAWVNGGFRLSVVLKST